MLRRPQRACIAARAVTCRTPRLDSPRFRPFCQPERAVRARHRGVRAFIRIVRAGRSGSARFESALAAQIRAVRAPHRPVRGRFAPFARRAIAFAHSSAWFARRAHRFAQGAHEFAECFDRLIRVADEFPPAKRGLFCLVDGLIRDAEGLIRDADRFPRVKWRMFPLVGRFPRVKRRLFRLVGGLVSRRGVAIAIGDPIPLQRHAMLRGYDRNLPTRRRWNQELLLFLQESAEEADA